MSAPQVLQTPPPQPIMSAHSSTDPTDTTITAYPCDSRQPAFTALDPSHTVALRSNETSMSSDIQSTSSIQSTFTTPLREILASPTMSFQPVSPCSLDNLIADMLHTPPSRPTTLVTSQTLSREIIAWIFAQPPPWNASQLWPLVTTWFETYHPLDVATRIAMICDTSRSFAQYTLQLSTHPK